MPLARRELLLGGAAALFAQKKAPPASPNILLIIADDVGAWMLGCYGNKEIRTPNLDLLARGGTRFANHFAFTPAPAPSRATLFTGRLPSQHGIQDSLPAKQTPPFQNEITISDLLSAQGYNCGYAGKWDLGGDATPQHHYNFWETAPDRVDAKAGEFLDQQGAGKPFFLTVSYPSPYDRSRAPKVDELYAKSTFEGMGRDPMAVSADRGKEMMRDLLGNLRRFAAGLTAIDDRIPAILRKLSERGVRDSTLIVFCGSSGFLLGRHGLWSDGAASHPVNMYEEVMAVPMIWNWPGRIPVESVRNELVSLYDMMPTLCEIAGAQLPAGRRLFGRSYAALAHGRTLPKKQPWRNLVFGQYGEARMIRDSRYKLVLRNQNKGPNELFDLSRDPRERTNQFDNPAYLSTRDQLSKQFT